MREWVGAIAVEMMQGAYLVAGGWLICQPGWMVDGGWWLDELGDDERMQIGAVAGG